MCAQRNKNEQLLPRAQLYGWTSAEMDMKVRLTSKLSELINGVDLSNAREGDVLDLSPRDALVLIAEGWASPVYQDRSNAHDRPPRIRRKKKN